MSHEQSKSWFSQQIEGNLDSLYGAAMRLTRNRADAEDLVAEAVVNAWKSIESLEDRGRFRPWIFQILRNRFYSDCRRTSARPSDTPLEDLFGCDESAEISTFMMDQTDEFLGWWANPETDCINEFLGEQIRSAIESLPVTFRTVVLLINVDGLGYDETAIVLGIPTGTVRSRMKRGRTLLQKKLWQLAREEGIATHLTGTDK